MEHEVSDRNEWFKDVKRLIGMCDACADRCGGTLCQSMALHNICNRIHSLLAGDGE